MVSLYALWAGWLDTLSLPVYLCMGAMVLVGAAMQGMGGLGYAMFCAPLAALYFPQLVPGPLLAVGAPLALLAYLRERQALDMRVAAAALAGRVVGTAAAAGLLSLVDADGLAIFFALLILSAVALSLVGWRVAPTAGNLSVAGLFSGVMGTITSAGGPPFAIAMQQLPPATLRATLGVVFFIGTLVSLAALTWVDRMGATQWFYSLALLPWMLAGFGVSSALARSVSRSSIRHWLLGTALVSALIILWQAL